MDSAARNLNVLLNICGLMGEPLIKVYIVLYNKHKIGNARVDRDSKVDGKRQQNDDDWRQKMTGDSRR